MSEQNIHKLIEQLQELLSKATHGPWCCCTIGHMGCREIGYIGNIEIHSPSSPFQRAKSEHDARLLVAAVNALPALLAIAEAAAVISNQRNGQYLIADMDETLKDDNNLRAALSLLTDQRPGEVKT